MLLSEEEYRHAAALLSGERKKTPLFADLEQWFEETYKIDWETEGGISHGEMPVVPVQ